MINLILSGIGILLLGIYLGIKIKEWSLNLNEKILRDKQVKQDNDIYKKILDNIIGKKTKFKTRVNNTIYLGTKIPDIGKVEIVYILDRRDIAVFQDTRCILTSENVEKQTLDKITQSIDEVHQEKINDVIDVLGLIFSREDFEKTFNVNLEEIKKQTMNFMKDKSEKSDIESIISDNKTKFDIDEILDKINKLGIESLTKEERIFLDNYSK